MDKLALGQGNAARSRLWINLLNLLKSRPQEDHPLSVLLLSGAGVTQLRVEILPGAVRRAVILEQVQVIAATESIECATLGGRVAQSLLRGLTVIGKSSGNLESLRTRPPRWDRVSWRELRRD